MVSSVLYERLSLHLASLSYHSCPLQTSCLEQWEEAIIFWETYLSSQAFDSLFFLLQFLLSQHRVLTWGKSACVGRLAKAPASLPLSSHNLPKDIIQKERTLSYFLFCVGSRDFSDSESWFSVPCRIEWEKDRTLSCFSCYDSLVLDIGITSFISFNLHTIYMLYRLFRSDN